jgi:hypothetical protein
MFSFGQNGMKPVTEVKADSQGNFSIDQPPSAQGPTMLRVDVDDVTYNKLLPPGSPTTGVTIEVSNATKDGGAVKVTRHMILFQPTGDEMTVDETYVLENHGNTTWMDKTNGTLHFWVPSSVKGEVQGNGTAPDGLPVPIPTAKSSQPNVYDAKFEVKPGQTRFDLVYNVPYKPGEPYSGRVVTKDENTYLIVPNGVSIEGTGLKDMGTEPHTQAHIFGMTGDAYTVKLTGTLERTSAEGGGDSGEGEGAPLEQIMPKVYGKAGVIVGLALGILALGFAVLYRAGGARGAPAQEANERSRR